MSTSPPSLPHESTQQLPNPVLILIDTDSLLQVLIAEETRLLRFVKRTYRIQPAITEAVEVETRGKLRVRARFQKDLDKILSEESLVVLDTRTLPAYVTTDAHAVYNSMQAVGFDYARNGLDYGEAYTYAAAIVLKAPVISNDLNAVKTARKKALQLPISIARTFDLVALCHQGGYLQERDCDAIRQVLFREREFLPAAFQHSSFAKGLDHFYLRFVDCSTAITGASDPITELDVRIVLSRSP